MIKTCPQCKVGNLQLDNGVYLCSQLHCTYVDVHPINFENDVVQFEGENNQANRYTTIYHPCFDNGGTSIGRESSFDANYKRAKKIISNCCFVLKLSQSLADLAENRAYKILRILQSLKEEGGKEEKKERHKNYYSVKNVSCYSVFSACFEKENYFEEFNVCKFANIGVAAWRDVVRELNNFLKDKIEFIPVTQAKHMIMRVCRKRKIRAAEERAMIEMSERIISCGEFDIRNNTIAAMVFWKVCENSEEYIDQINLNDICRSHEKMMADHFSKKEIWKYFDVTPENVRKVFKDFISNRMKEFLPTFQGMIHPSKRDF